MDFMNILAQGAPPTTSNGADQIVPIDVIWGQVTSLGWFEAVIAISFGVVYLLYGWRIFKVLAVISFGLIGLQVGVWAGNQIDNQILGGVIGLVLFAGLSIPLMKWSVSLLGALAGGVLAAAIWYAFKLDETYIWAGALIGVVAGGMISFILLKAAVMLFTSLGGAAITITGMLALLYQYEPTSESITAWVHEINWFLPLALIVPTALGIIMQRRLIKHSPKWEI